MGRDISSIQRKWAIVCHGFLMAGIAAGLSACAAFTPAPELIEGISCPTESPGANIYRTTLPLWEMDIYSYAATPFAATPTSPDLFPAEEKILQARYAAFQYLLTLTKRWSDVQTVRLDDSSQAHIAVTFLSPDLIHAVYLSETLRNRLFIPDFDVKAQEMLNSVAERNELLFLVTVTSSNYGIANAPGHVLEIPISQMALVNAEDLRIRRDHDDHVLEEPIPTSLGSVYGYVAYPLAVQWVNGCNWILDPKFNTSIVLSVPYIKVDDIDRGSFTWTIPYSALIRSDMPPATPVFTIPGGYDVGQISPTPAPPTPAVNFSFGGAIPDAYWEDLARFIWNQVTLGNYH